ncbi:MAG: hypothetical protein LBD24_09590 [Spirochaetaceae bacterium]|nr:hypothetical protein [Spirochaetaceae bacterium]
MRRVSGSFYAARRRRASGIPFGASGIPFTTKGTPFVAPARRNSRPFHPDYPAKNTVLPTKIPQKHPETPVLPATPEAHKLPASHPEADAAGFAAIRRTLMEQPEAAEAAGG